MFCISVGPLVTIHTSNIGNPPPAFTNNNNDHKTPAPEELIHPYLGILDHPHTWYVVLEREKSI